MSGKKDDSGKLRFDLLPVAPLMELAHTYTMGAAKYAERNWEKGIRYGRVFAAMMRHAWKWWNGEQNDPVDGQHHLSSVAWCAFALMEYERTHPEFDDRPHLDGNRNPNPASNAQAGYGKPPTLQGILPGANEMVCSSAEETHPDATGYSK